MSGFAKFKTMVNYIIHWILLEKPDPNIYLNFKLPKFFRKFVGFALRGAPADLERRKYLIISLLNIYRIIKFPIEVDIDSIIKPYTGKYTLDWTQDEENIDDKSRYIKEKLIYNAKIISKVTRVPPRQEMNLCFQFSSSPNGSVSSLGIMQDFIAINQDAYLFNNLWKFNCLLKRKLKENDKNGNNVFNYLVSSCEKLVKFDSESRNLDGRHIHSRLHFLQDKAGKTRNIAIGDYFSQVLLRPLHKQIFVVLKALRSDGTHNQELQVKRIFKYLSENKLGSDILNFYSVDMKSCTERFPVEVQRQCLVNLGIFDTEESYFWKEIISNREFVYVNTKQVCIKVEDILKQWKHGPLFKVGSNRKRFGFAYKLKYGNKPLKDKQYWYNKFILLLKKSKSEKAQTKLLNKIVYVNLETIGKLKYSVGQPMGLYSSWASMSISHHVLVWMSYSEWIVDCLRLFKSLLDSKYEVSQIISYFEYLLSKFERKGFSEYSILGDDVVIFNPEVGKKYIFFLKYFGIGISIEKCFISYKVCEFAKCYITSKSYFKPMSSSLLANCCDKYIFETIKSSNSKLDHLELVKLSNNRSKTNRFRAIAEIASLLKFNKLVQEHFSVWDLYTIVKVSDIQIGKHMERRNKRKDNFVIRRWLLKEEHARNVIFICFILYGLNVTTHLEYLTVNVRNFNKIIKDYIIKFIQDILRFLDKDFNNIFQRNNNVFHSKDFFSPFYHLLVQDLNGVKRVLHNLVRLAITIDSIPGTKDYLIMYRKSYYIQLIDYCLIGLTGSEYWISVTGTYGYKKLFNNNNRLFFEPDIIKCRFYYGQLIVILNYLQAVFINWSERDIVPECEINNIFKSVVKISSPSDLQTKLERKDQLIDFIKFVDKWKRDLNRLNLGIQDILE